MAHLIERSMSICLPLVAEVVPHIGEEVEDLLGTLYEVQPTFLNVVPRILEKIASQVAIGMQRSSPVKRRRLSLGRWRSARATAEAIWAGAPARLTLSLLDELAAAVVFQPLLRKIGLSKIRSHSLRRRATAAQNSGDVAGSGRQRPQPVRHHRRRLRAVSGAGVSAPLGNGRDCRFRRDRCAAPTMASSWCAARACSAATGRTSKAPRTILIDGWLHTGDVVETNDANEWRIVDRKKDIMITSGGKNIAPSEIENLLKSSPYISEAALIGDGRKFVSALIEIDFGTVSEWARRNGVVYTGFTSLASHEDGRRTDRGGDRRRQRHPGARRTSQEIPDHSEGA